MRVVVLFPHLLGLLLLCKYMHGLSIEKSIIYLLELLDKIKKLDYYGYRTETNATQAKETKHEFTV